MTNSLMIRIVRTSVLLVGAFMAGGWPGTPFVAKAKLCQVAGQCFGY
jgi:hypothetical protein